MTDIHAPFLQQIRTLVIEEARTRGSVEETKYLAIQAVKSLDHENLDPDHFDHHDLPPTARDILLFTHATPGDSFTSYPTRDSAHHEQYQACRHLAAIGLFTKGTRTIDETDDTGSTTFHITPRGDALATKLRTITPTTNG